MVPEFIMDCILLQFMEDSERTDELIEDGNDAVKPEDIVGDATRTTDLAKAEEDHHMRVCVHEAAHALAAINLGGDLTSIAVLPSSTTVYGENKKVEGLTTYNTDGIGKVTGPLKRKPGTITDEAWAKSMTSFAGTAYEFWKYRDDKTTGKYGTHLDRLFTDTVDGKNALKYLLNDASGKDANIDHFLDVYGEDGWWILIDVYRDALDLTRRYDSELKILSAYLNSYATEDAEGNAAGFTALNAALTAGNIALGTVAGAAGIVSTVAGGAVKVAGGIGSVIGHFLK